MKFKGFKSGGVTYRLSRRPGHVMTYQKPYSACLFAASCFGRVELTAIDEDLGEVPILDAQGQPVDGAEEYLSFLLSDDEWDLLGLFGVDLQRVRKRAGRRYVGNNEEVSFG